MDQGRRELDPLLVAERELLDAVASALGEPEPLDPAVRVAHPMQRGEIRELVAYAHLRIQPALLGHVAEAPAHVEIDWLAAPGHLPGVGLEHAHDDPHR